MALTSTQLQTVKTDITVTRAAVSFQGQTLLQWWNAGNDMRLAEFYNQPANPVVKIWKPAIEVKALNDALVMAEFILLTVAKQNGWFVLTQGPADATLPRTRQNFIDVFGGASVTMTNLTAVAQQNATYLEALFSAAGGSPGTGNVSTLYGYRLDGTDVGQSRSA